MYAICTFNLPIDATRERYEEKLSYAFTLTIGKIFEKVKNIIPEGMRPKVEEAIKKRNFLAHHFWYEKSHLMFSIENIQQLIEDLNDYATLFNEIDEILVKMFEPYVNKFDTEFGINEEIQKSLEKIKDGVPPEPLMKKRKLRKKEKIINVYIAPPNNTLVFQADDSALLLLCDIGLGWSNLNKPESNWTINEKIQKYLPIEINPRPKIIEPWNYDFKLKHDKILHIKKENNIIHYGIKTIDKKEYNR